MHILIGTNNKYKQAEMLYMLEGIKGLEIHYLNELGKDIDVKEDGQTLLENSEKKAKEISKQTDYYVFTSDVGVDIPGLGDKWDVLKNQRIVGPNRTDLEKANKVLELMKSLKGEERSAVTRMAITIAKNGVILHSKEAITERGYIAEKLPGEKIPPYKWMGHLIWAPEYNKVLNLLTKDQQKAWRDKGIVKLKNYLNSIIGCM